MKRASVIVAILLAVTVVGLFIPVVKSVGTVAARTTCANNLKTLGVALHNYNSANEKVPFATALPPTREHSPEKRMSWFYEITPFLIAHMDPKWVANRKVPFDDPENWYVTRSNQFASNCPANPHPGAPYPYTHYVGITGVGKDAAWRPLGDPDAGFFGYERVITLADLKRGESNVLAVSETATDNGPWAKGGPSSARGLDLNGTDYLGEHGQLNSFHGRNGLNRSAFLTQVLMADASVRGLTVSISVDALESMARIATRE
jgi:hypothetical protein